MKLSLLGEEKASPPLLRAIRVVLLLTIICLTFSVFWGSFKAQHSSSGEEGPEISATPLRQRLHLSIALSGEKQVNGSPSSSPTHDSPFLLGPPLKHQEHASANPECSLLRRSEVKTVAVVGNGPLSPEQRQEVSKHSIVIRFNFLNNMWRNQERMDIWIVRYSYDANRRFWGFEQLPKEEVMALLEKSQSVWLILSSSNVWAVDELLAQFPLLQSHQVVVVDQDPFARPSPGQSEEAMPSTGLIGLITVLSCLHPQKKVHIYGMNWTPKIWGGHDVTEEAVFISELEDQGHIQVHKTPCSGMRSCTDVELDSDCHFDLQQKFVCPKVSHQKGSLDERGFASVQEVIADAGAHRIDYLGNLAEKRGGT